MLCEKKTLHRVFISPKLTLYKTSDQLILFYVLPFLLTEVSISQAEKAYNSAKVIKPVRSLAIVIRASSSNFVNFLQNANFFLDAMELQNVSILKTSAVKDQTVLANLPFVTKFPWLRWDISLLNSI